MTDTCCFVSIAVAAVDIPASSHRALIGCTHLAAMGLLIAERDADQEWRFTLKHQAIAAGESENLLLNWASQTLPETAILLGWQLRTAIFQPLLEAGSDSDPEISRAFLARLKLLVSRPCVDLAVRHGGAGAPSFEKIAGKHGIASSVMTTVEAESAWAFGERHRLRHHVELQAIATWRLWLAELNGGAEAATAAFEAWLG